MQRFEQSDLPERQKALLRVAAAYLGAPSSLTPAARAEALEHFTPEELVAMLLKLTALTFHTPRVALGFDAPVDPDALTFFEYGDDGVAVLVTPPS